MNSLYRYKYTALDRLVLKHGANLQQNGNIDTRKHAKLLEVSFPFLASFRELCEPKHMGNNSERTMCAVIAAIYTLFRRQIFKMHILFNIVFVLILYFHFYDANSKDIESHRFEFELQIN